MDGGRKPLVPAATRVSSEQIMEEMPLPIALVGNGPIPEGTGDQIDRFATVIRCNNFRLAGHESRTGTRTTHWCVHGLADRLVGKPKWRQRTSQLFNPHRIQGIHPNPHVDPSVTVYCPRAFDWLMLETFRAKIGRELPCLHDARLLVSLHAQITFPTIGFTAAALLLHFHEEISLFGFAGLRGGHYWKPHARHESGHQGSGLRELELLRENSRIRFPVQAA